MCRNVEQTIKTRDILNCHSPILTCALISETLKFISDYSVKNKYRCLKLINDLFTFCKSIQISKNDEKYIKYLMTQKDLRGRTVFQIAAENNFFLILETPEIGTIVKKLWNGKVTNNGILSSSSFQKYLDESTTILNNPFDRFDEVDINKPYFYQLCSWTESCSLRYWPESISTILLIIIYNLYIFFLVNDGHIMTSLKEPNFPSRIRILLYVYIAWILCIFFNILNQIIFCLFVKRSFKFDLWRSVEILLLLAAFALLIEPNELFGSNDYNGNLLKSDEASDFPFLVRGIILSLNDILVWLRITGILLTFKEIGPLIRMISLLSLKTLKYLLVYAIYLAGFSTIFVSLFYRDSVLFSSFKDSIFNLFGGFINNFNVFEFKNYKFLGAIITVFYVTLSGMMLTNLLIASLTNVYKSLSYYVDVSHRSVLITYYRRYKWDEDYGFLILLSTPFNFINIFFLPAYLFLSKRFSKEKLNKVICRIYFILFYFPAILMMSFLYNLILLPVIYFKGILDSLIHEFISRNFLFAIISNIFKWILFGPFFLTIIIMRDHYIMICNVFKNHEIPLSEKKRIKKYITNDDVICLVKFIHKRTKENQNNLHTLFIDFLNYQQEKKAENDNMIKERSYYIEKISSFSKKNLSNKSSYILKTNSKKKNIKNIKRIKDYNNYNDNENNEDFVNNYVKRNIIIIEILENFLIDDGSDNYIVDIQKFKMLLPNIWYIDDRYLKRLVFTQISSLNRAVNNLNCKKNNFLRYELLNQTTNCMSKLDRCLDGIHDFNNDDLEDKQFYGDLVDLLVKIGGDLREYEEKLKKDKYLSRQMTMRKNSIIKEKEENNRRNSLFKGKEESFLKNITKINNNKDNGNVRRISQFMDK